MDCLTYTEHFDINYDGSYLQMPKDHIDRLDHYLLYFSWRHGEGLLFDLKDTMTQRINGGERRELVRERGYGCMLPCNY